MSAHVGAAGDRHGTVRLGHVDDEVARASEVGDGSAALVEIPVDPEGDRAGGGGGDVEDRVAGHLEIVVDVDVGGAGDGGRPACLRPVVEDVGAGRDRDGDIAVGHERAVFLGDDARG